MSRKPGMYYRPENLDDALRLLAQPDMVPLAGGTQLLASEEGLPVAGVVDLQALGLNRIRRQNGRLHIGATATLTTLAAFLAQDGPADGPAPLLQKAISQAGPNTYRNAATLGGVIAGRLPDSELLAALLVLDTELSLRAPAATTLPLAAYLAADERPSGLITAIDVPWAAGEGHSARVARTPADDPIVSVTLWQPPEGAPRLAATGIGERPLRLETAEAVLAAGINDETIETAAAAASAASSHPGDFRGDAAYRADMVAVLTRRVLRAV